MNEQKMRSRVHYLFCDHCNDHVAVEPVEGGRWLVHCPDCMGECLACGCKLQEICLKTLKRGLEIVSGKKERSS